jgi:hypothetical protein
MYQIKHGMSTSGGVISEARGQPRIVEKWYHWGGENRFSGTLKKRFPKFLDTAIESRTKMEIPK